MAKITFAHEFTNSPKKQQGILPSVFEVLPDHVTQVGCAICSISFRLTGCTTDLFEVG
jgi:hypothetical protein